MGEIALSSKEVAANWMPTQASIKLFLRNTFKNFIETGMSAISQMMGYPLFDRQEIDNEREVVIEEIKSGQDGPDRRASSFVFKTA